MDAKDHEVFCKLAWFLSILSWYQRTLCLCLIFQFENTESWCVSIACLWFRTLGRTSSQSLGDHSWSISRKETISFSRPGFGTLLSLCVFISVAHYQMNSSSGSLQPARRHLTEICGKFFFFFGQSEISDFPDASIMQFPFTNASINSEGLTWQWS